MTHVENEQYIRLENGDSDLSVIVCHQSHNDKKVMEIWGFFSHFIIYQLVCVLKDELYLNDGLFVDKALWQHMPFHVN